MIIITIWIHQIGLTYSDNQDTQGYLFDIDMSGTLDLVIFPTKVNSSSKVEIYTTNKNLTD